jgi:hypothetical protein
MFSLRIATRLPWSFIVTSDQDFLEVFEKKLPTSGRKAVEPHAGQDVPPLSCALIDIVTVTSRWHLSQ